MGTRRTATAILEMRGSYKHDPKRRLARLNEPKPLGDLGEPPAHLKKKAREVWYELKAEIPPGVATNADRFVFEVLVDLVQRQRAGTLMAIERTQLLRCLAQMGLTPADRSRVSAIPQKPEKKNDPLDEFVGT